MNMVNTTYNSKNNMNKKLQSLKGKTKLNFSKIISNYYNELKHKNFQSQDDAFAKNAQGISKIYHEVILLRKLLQTKPQVKNMKNNYYDLYYTVIKVRNENKDMDNQYENDENDYIKNNDFFSNQYIRIRPRETLLR